LRSKMEQIVAVMGRIRMGYDLRLDVILQDSLMRS